MKKARNSGLFKVDVPQAVEEFTVFDHSKKCFLCSGDFQRRSYIFCAAVVNKKAFWQRRNCAAIVKDKAAWFRWANDNFLITVPPLVSFPLLVTVLFVGKGG